MKQKDPPLGVAFAQAKGSIKQRPLRQIASGTGVSLGIALFSGVQASRLLNPAATNDLENQQKLKFLVFLSLTLSLTGIINSMLMSVTERYREIGTLKCLGARNSFIVKIFLIESAIVGFFSSLIGVIFGIGTVLLFKAVQTGLSSSNWAAITQVTFLSMAIGMGITILATIIPAIQASRMPATSALRVEI